MFISVAMTKTGLDRRIALNVLSRIGTKTSRIYIGVIFTGFILSFFVPSATARLACLIPIILGILDSLGINRQSVSAWLPSSLSGPPRRIHFGISWYKQQLPKTWLP